MYISCGNADFSIPPFAQPINLSLDCDVFEALSHFDNTQSSKFIVIVDILNLPGNITFFRPTAPDATHASTTCSCGSVTVFCNGARIRVWGLSVCDRCLSLRAFFMKSLEFICNIQDHCGNFIDRQLRTP